MTRKAKIDPLLVAIDEDAYQWLQESAPRYLSAIEQALEDGDTPESVYSVVSYNVGPDRQGIARRCQQAARHIQRTA